MELKNTMNEMKNAVESFNRRICEESKRKKISEFKDRSFEIIQSEEKREKRIKKDQPKEDYSETHYN